MQGGSLAAATWRQKLGGSRFAAAQGGSGRMAGQQIGGSRFAATQGGSGRMSGQQLGGGGTSGKNHWQSK